MRGRTVRPTRHFLAPSRSIDVVERGCGRNSNSASTLKDDDGRDDGHFDVSASSSSNNNDVDDENVGDDDNDLTVIFIFRLEEYRIYFNGNEMIVRPIDMAPEVQTRPMLPAR